MQRNDALQDNYYTLNDKVKKLQEQMGELEKRDNNVYRAIFEAAPIPDSARARENQHEQEMRLVQGMDQENLYTSVAATLDQLSARIASQSKSYVQIDGFIKNKEQLLACTPAIQPVNNKDLSRIASGFGYRIDPVYKTTKFHPMLAWISRRPRERPSMLPPTARWRWQAIPATAMVTMSSSITVMATRPFMAICSG